MSKVKSSLINNFKALFWALIIAGVIRTFAIEPFKIPSGSMKPNLLVGDFLFVSKWDYGYSRYSFPFGLPPFKGKIFESKPERGDIIVFKLPGQENINYVKRLVGLPGETIKVVNGKIYLKTKNSTDFKVLDQVEDGFFYDDQYGKEIQQLIENEYRVLNITNDGPLDYSPEYKIPKDKFGVGFVPKVNIVGKVWFIWFSVDTDFSLSKFWNLPFHIRYDRLFNIIK